MQPSAEMRRAALADGPDRKLEIIQCAENNTGKNAPQPETAIAAALRRAAERKAGHL
jgi:hypothetical protein